MMANEHRELKEKIEQLQTKANTCNVNRETISTNNQKYTIHIEGLINRKVIEINKNLTINNIVASLMLDTLTDYYVWFSNR